MQITVYFPENAAHNTPMGAFIVSYGSAGDLVSKLLAHDGGPVVIDSTGIDDEGQRAVATALREHGLICIEVRRERWDGFSPSPLSAACRGVIAGFGDAGIAAAVRLFAEQP